MKATTRETSNGMTHQEFLSIFAKHLYVGGAKRTELVDELRTHLEELDSKESPEIKLGSPRQLARRYNREHLGLLGSVGFMYSLPAVITILILLSFYTGLYSGSDLVGNVLFAVSVGCILISPILVAYRLSLFHQAKRKIALYLLLSPLIAAATMTMVAFLASLFNVRNGWVGSFFGHSPIDPPEGTHFQWRENSIAALNIVWFGYFFSLTIFLMTVGIRKLGISVYNYLYKSKG